jgi:hypothetical protein
MIWTQKRCGTPTLRLKRHDSARRIISEYRRNSSVESRLPRCGSQPVAFLPQAGRHPADFWADLGQFAGKASPPMPLRQNAASTVNVTVTPSLAYWEKSANGPPLASRVWSVPECV